MTHPCVVHTQKYTNAAFPNDNPFLSLFPTHFHPEIPVVCSIPLFHPLCLSSLSFSLLLPVYFLSSYFLSSPLSLTGPTVKGVYHRLSVAMCLCLQPAVLSSYHLFVMTLVLVRTQEASSHPQQCVQMTELNKDGHHVSTWCHYPQPKPKYSRYKSCQLALLHSIDQTVKPSIEMPLISPHDLYVNLAWLSTKKI